MALTGYQRHTETVLSPTKLVGLLAEPDRRRIVAALILSSGDLADVTERAGLETKGAVDALDRLINAGLVELGSDGTYVVVEALFKAAARSDRTGLAQDGRGSDDDADPVLARSFDEGRLVHLPRKRSKRLLVLDRLAQEFEPGRHYSEREVNQILRTFDGDVATLRRYLVDERFLDRAEGAYWRSGGTVDV